MNESNGSSLKEYYDFLDRRSQIGSMSGFEPLWMPDCLFPFQASVTEWTIRKGRGAALESCGLGKTIQQLVRSENIVRKTNKRSLILTPLAVSQQTVKEAEKFGIECVRSSDGKFKSTAKIVVTNYDRLHYFNPNDFIDVTCDESGAIKNFTGKRTTEVTEFMRKMPYRSLWTATPAPNDYIELGTSAEALGEMGYQDMLTRFFKLTKHDYKVTAWHRQQKYVMKQHGEHDFWRWICSWARAVRKPSDLGFDDTAFLLPPLEVNEHIITAKTKRPGFMFDMPAMTLEEQREERRRTIPERCEKVASLVSNVDGPSVIWCHLNDEADLCEKLVKGSVQISGSDDDDVKEERLIAFANGQISKLVIKPIIGAWGLNWQHCSHQTMFPSHCYDETTEVLTKQGWTTFDKVSLESEVATVNQESLAFEWQKPTDVIWNNYEGDMIHFYGGKGSSTSKNFDLLVTPNHKMFVKRAENRYTTNCGTWTLIEAGKLQSEYKRQEYRMLSAPKSFSGNYIDFVPIPFPEHISEKHSTIKRLDAYPIEEFVKLAGWYITEGYCGKRNGTYDGQITISQSEINPEHRQEIIELLNSIPEITVHSKTKDIRFCCSQLAFFLTDQFGDTSQTKRIPGWMKELDTDLLSILRDTMLKGDGCSHERGGKKWFYRTTSKRLADDFSEICLKTGIRASVRHRGTLGEKGFCYDVSMARDNTEPTIYIRPEIEKYSGMIGCVTVPNRTVIIRRNGIPVVSGNSYEQYHQMVRRSWRFGQKNKVKIDMVTSEGEVGVKNNLQAKADAAEAMFDKLVELMNDHLNIRRDNPFKAPGSMPSWISQFQETQL
jgi:hypothetical protein